MAEQIRVNKNVLDNQCDALKTLCNSSDLTNAIAALEGVVSDSSGDSAEIARALKQEFTSIAEDMTLLFERTYEFLQNKHGDFVVADENM